MATHKNGISARQLGLQLGLGSYKTAWLLLRKLRHAMVDPGREPLAGPVEVDETGPSSRANLSLRSVGTFGPARSRAALDSIGFSASGDGCPG